MKTGTVLLYGCTGPEHSKLRQILAMLRLRMRPVEPGQYHLPLWQLAEGKAEEGGENTQPLPETLLVFCGLNEELLQKVLAVVRSKDLTPIALKAVLTQTNREWNTHQLYEELVRERDSLAQGQQAEHTT